MNILKSIIAISTMIFSIHSYATLDGPEEITVLGYQAKEQKVYLLRHYVDESGRLAQLYYFQLNQKTPDKLIEVKSVYNKINATADTSIDAKFAEELTKITKNLTPLKPVNKSNFKVNILNTETYSLRVWQNSFEKVPQYVSQFQIQNSDLRSNIQTAVNYDNKIVISQSYAIPQQNVQLAIVQYLGIPTETGYTVEEPILLLPKKQ